MTANTITRAVAKRENTDVVKFMWTSAAHLKAVLPEHLDVKSFLGTAAAALYADDKLMAAAIAKPDTLTTALFRCAALGHQPGTDEYYLTIRKGGILGIEGYRGVVERMYRSGAVKTVIVREVCAKDKFRYTEGIDEKPVHSFGGEGGTGADFFGAEGFRDRGMMVGLYAYAVLMTGAVSRVVILNRADVMAARDASDAADSSYSPWNRLDAGKDHPEFTGRSMWWKTGAKRLEPWVPTSAEYRREMLRAANAVQAAAAEVPAAAAAVAQMAAEDEIADAEIVEDGTSDDGAKQEAAPVNHDDSPGRDAKPVTANDVNATFRRLGFGPKDKDDVFAAAAAFCDRPGPVKALADLSAEELAGVAYRLAGCETRDDVTELHAQIIESRGPGEDGRTDGD